MSRRLRENIDLLLSKETGTVYKDPGGRTTVALVYPNTYHVGMSNLGFQGIYGLLNSMPDVVCERAFLPDERDLYEYARTGTELFSMESKKPLARFDIVAFSVSFENDYPGILKILGLAKIPFRASERTGRHPLVIMGGVCAFLNPEPVADFFDICFVGEADEMLPEFMSAWRARPFRDDAVKMTESVNGLYVPQAYNISYCADGRIESRTTAGKAPDIIRRRYLKDVSASRMTTSIVTPATEFSDTYLIEAMRGCPWNCRFCAVGNIYNPPRKKGFQEIEREILGRREKSARVGVIAPSLSDYPHSQDILKIPGVDFSITSLRAGRKSVDLISMLKGHKSVSIAPEAGTERLRRVINKKITEEDILFTAELMFKEGIETLRLYFMIGLPTETRADIDGIIGLAEKITSMPSRRNLTLSINTFVPKAFTPFQWHFMEEPDVVRDRLKMIRKRLLPVKGVKVFHDVPKYAYMQGLFARGDRRVSRVIEEMQTEKDWAASAEKAGLSKDFYLFRQRTFDEILPWDFIDSGSSKERLWEEYQTALSETS